jgi:hypothetical protein
LCSRHADDRMHGCGRNSCTVRPIGKSSCPTMRSASRDTTDLLRAGGALLLAAGATTLFIRKGEQHAWSEVALLLVVFAPTLLLYRLALPGSDRGTTIAKPSRSVTMIAAILLSPLAIAQLLSVLGVTGTPLPIAVFALTGLIAAVGAERARVAYAALLAGLAALVTWLIVWGQILDHPKAGAFRGLLLIAGGLLLLAAVRLGQRGGIGAKEIGTVGALALVLAGTIGIFVSASGQISDPVTSILTSTGSHATNGGQRFGWDLYLLVVSAGLIWVGARVRSRGMGYVGGFGILAFILSVGFQFDRLYADKAPTGSLAGWPLALLILGALGLSASSLRGSETET